MSAVYVIAKEGEYQHHVPGVHASLEAAMDEAVRLARDDGLYNGMGTPDGYHNWSIFVYEPGVEPPQDPVITVGWEHPRTTEWSGDKVVWVPVSGLGYWHGSRPEHDPPIPLPEENP